MTGTMQLKGENTVTLAERNSTTRAQIGVLKQSIESCRGGEYAYQLRILDGGRGIS